MRLAHGFLAASVFILLLSGALIRWAPERADSILSYHYLAAALLIATWVVRISLLLFGKTEPERMQSLLPNRHQLNQSWQVLRSYLTLGKIALPKWYAHNPFWAPLYLLLFAILLLQIFTGLALQQQITLLGGISLRSVHIWGYELLLGFTLLHIAASFFHEINGSGSDISAIISGYRIFIVEALQPPPTTTPTIVSLRGFRKKP